MRKLIIACSLVLAACGTTKTGTGPVTSLPGGAQACAVVKSDKFDLALRAYGAAVDAVNMLIDANVLKPGTPKALAVANANDRVLAGFAIAQRARGACNATDYLAALNQVQLGIAELRQALKS
jgi:hypothetical protein